MVGRFLKMFSICVDFIKPWLYQKGRKSPNGKAIYGSQYRTRECFWLGKPCKNHQTVEFQPICNDPDVKICDTGKSLSEALIFASINPQYGNRLFVELP